MNCLTQKQATDKLKKLKVGALFMEMGTGKTKTILDIYKAKNITNKIVYIAPASIIRGNTIKNEVLKWYPNLLDRIEFFSSEGIGSSDTTYLKLFETLKAQPCFLIVDESIKFKNLSAKRTKRILEIAPFAKYRFILNGTPVTRSILDILAQMDILSPKILNMNEFEFANRFLIYELNGRFKSWRAWSKPKNEEALMSLVEPYVVETSLDLEVNIKFKNEYFSLNECEELEYREHKKDFLAKNIKVEYLAMAQSFQHFYTFNEHKKDFLAKTNKEKTLFFVKFKKWFEVLPSLLDCEVGIYNADRKDNLDNFDTCVLTYGCGAFGLNLQKFNRIVFVDSTFDYGQKIQALSRVKRLGQLNDIEIVNLWTQTKLETIIQNSLDKKINTANNIKKILENMNKGDLECL